MSAAADHRKAATVLKLVPPAGSDGHTPRLQRSQGEVRLAFKAGVDGRTALGDLYQQGCMKARLPRQTGAGHQAVFINTAGGLTGGDSVRLTTVLGEGTHAAITTQACERIYKAATGCANVSSRLVVAKDATALWLPQETILFEGASLSRRMHAELERGAVLVACEAIVLGRPAMGEVVHRARLRDEWVIDVDGSPVLIDRLGLEGDLSALFDRAAVGDGARCFASVMAVGSGTARQCAQAREMIAASGLAGGATDLGGAMLARVLAPNSHELRLTLMPLLQEVSGTQLPRIWHM